MRKNGQPCLRCSPLQLVPTAPTLSWGTLYLPQFMLLTATEMVLMSHSCFVLSPVPKLAVHQVDYLNQIHLYDLLIVPCPSLSKAPSPCQMGPEYQSYYDYIHWLCVHFKQPWWSFPVWLILHHIIYLYIYHISTPPFPLRGPKAVPKRAIYLPPKDLFKMYADIMWYILPFSDITEKPTLCTIGMYVKNW